MLVIICVTTTYAPQITATITHFLQKLFGGRHGGDRMGCGFTTTCAKHSLQSLCPIRNSKVFITCYCIVHVYVVLIFVTV
jgi:hypothetical protein